MQSQKLTLAAHGVSVITLTAVSSATVKAIFPWSPLQTICRYLRLCYHRKKGVRKWTYFSIILKFIIDFLGVKPSHWLLRLFCPPAHTQAVVSAEVQIAPRHLCCSLSSQGSGIPAGDILREASKSALWAPCCQIQTDLTYMLPYRTPPRCSISFNPVQRKHIGITWFDHPVSLHGLPKNSNESQVYNVAFNFLQIQQFTQLSSS